MSKSGKSGKKKSKKNQYRKCLGVCYPTSNLPPELCDMDSDNNDWQMSPFSNDRYDQDEIKRLERKGVKAKHQLEALKRRLAGEEEPEASFSHAEKTVTKPKRVMPSSTPRPALRSGGREFSCRPEILYQPYGPLIAPVRSYARPFNSEPSVYCYLGPSFYTAYRFKVPAPSTVSTTPCPEAEPSMAPNLADLSHYASSYAKSYIPLGP